MLSCAPSVPPMSGTYETFLFSLGRDVIIPFLGFLSIFKVRIFPWFASFYVIWFVTGVFAIGGGVTPMSKYDIVTPADRQAWFSSPFVHIVGPVWATGLAIGILLLAITWIREYRHLGPRIDLLNNLITIGVFGWGLWTFATTVVAPRLR